MLASEGAFPIPLPSDVTQHILSFIPPVWTEITRETPLPANGYFKMVPSEGRCRFKQARFFLVTEGYGFQVMKRGEINFATREASLFLRHRKLPVPDVITVGDIFPQNASPKAIEDLLKFNYYMVMMRFSRL